MRNPRYMLALVAFAFLAGSGPSPDTGSVRGKVGAFKVGKAAPTTDVWVYLEDLGTRPDRRPGKNVTATITQKGIQFSPRVVVIPVGATIEFPNRDEIEHNVFSPIKEKWGFDLGRYGPSKKGKTWKFLEPIEQAIYCDIHRDMSATVKVVPSRYYAHVAADGTFAIDGVPPGRYKLWAWAPASRDVRAGPFEIAAGKVEDVGELHLQLGQLPATHLNKSETPYPIYP